MRVEYVARRRLAPAHSAGTTYTLDLELEDLQPPSPERIAEVQESMAGNVEVVYLGERRIWSVTIIPTQRSSAGFGLIDEFLSSVADGQVFNMDPYDNGQTLQVMRHSNTYTLTLFKQINGPDDYYSIAFQVREVE